jgi:hypothetical protein
MTDTPAAPDMTMKPDRLTIVLPRPHAQVWMRDGEVTSVIVTDCPKDASLPTDLSVLMFESDWLVTITEVHRP